MVDLSRWLPGLAPDPEDDDPISRTLRMLGLGGAEAEPEPAPVSTYNDPTAYPQQPAPYTPPPPADDPGGAGFAAQDAFSTPPLQDDRWRDEGPREAPAPTPAPAPAQRPYWAPTEHEAGAVSAGVEATRTAQPIEATSVGPIPLAPAVRQAAGYGLGALETLGAAEDYARARIDPRVWGFARDGIAREILSPDEFARFNSLASATTADGTPKSYADYAADRDEHQRFQDRIDARYQEIKDDPDALTRLAQASPAYRATTALTDVALSPAVGAVAARGASGAAGALGASARTARAAGYAADVAGQSLVDPTSLPLQPAGDLALRGLGAAARGAGRVVGGVADAAPSPAAADEGVQVLGSGVVPGGGRAPIQVVNNAAEQGIQALYHETSPRDAFILTSDLSGGLTGKYVSPDPAFALGQAGKGALVELGETGQMRVSVNRAKPGLRMLEDAGQGVKEMVVEDAPHPAGQYVRSITVQPDARMDPVARGISRGLERDGWTVETLADGSRKFSPPTAGAETVAGSGVATSPLAGLRADAFNAAQGGVAGAVSEDLEAAAEGRETDYDERLRRALGGAVLAGAAGRAARGGGGPALGVSRPAAPPVAAGPPAGHVRLYRGEGPLIGFGGGSSRPEDAGRWFTTSREYAQEYVDQATGYGTSKTPGRLLYVDVPEDVARQSIRGSLEGDVLSPSQSTELALPAEYVSRARPVAEAGSESGAAGRMARGGGPALGSGFVHSPGYQPPTPQAIAAAAQQGARRGAALNRAVSAPASDVPRMVREATAATDDRAGLRWAEDLLSDAAGAPRMRENDPLRPATQSRVNAGSIANSRIEADLETAIANTARAGLHDEIVVHLEDMHQRDILDEFYTRGHDAVMATRQQAIATAQANGASPLVLQRMQAKADADAQAAGEAAMRKRQGSNPEMTYEAIDARLQAQEAKLKASGQWGALQTEAQRVWDHNTETLQRLEDAGEVDPADAAYWRQAYPHYVPTVPVSHLDARGSGPVASATGPRVSRGTQKSVNALEDVGTSGDRLNPIVASRNATVRAERQIQRNTVARAFAQMMDDAVQASPGTMATDPATHRTFLGGGTDVTYMANGKPVTMSVPKAVADGLEAAANMGMEPNAAAGIWRKMMGFVTSAMTAGRASFLPVNVMRDLQDFATRTMAKEGGPQAIGGVMGTWLDEAGKAVGDIARAQANPRGAVGAAVGGAAGAAQGDEDTTLGERVLHGAEGALAGTFLGGASRVKATGAARQYLARGGGSGSVSAHWKPGQRWYRDVLRDGGVPITSPQDAARYFGDWLGDVASLQGIKGINERAELISRTAAMRRAETVRGLDPTEAMIAGRDASYDPDRAGVVARAFNGWVPFFNATVQGGAQTGRLFREHPVAATASIGATLAPVMLLAEAWNRSDPDRARAYDDVPQYVKDSGIVVVTPWAGSDTRGSRPNYVWIPTGMTTPIVLGMRKAMEGLPGLEPTAGRTGSRPDASSVEQWADTLSSVVQVFNPLRGDSPSAALSNLVPQGVKQALEIGMNKDLYRGNPIVSGPADERASAFSRGVAGGINTVGQTVGSDALQNVHPSQAEHLVRSLPAYGDVLTGGSDMAAPSGYKQAEERPVANEPFLGGIMSRFVRDTGGANLERAQGAMIPDAARSVLEEAGMRPEDVTPVPSTYKGATLTRLEQEQWQEITNRLAAREVAAARRSPEWRERGADRTQVVRDAMTRAREEAAARALRRLDAGEIERRIRREEAMKAAG